MSAQTPAVRNGAANGKALAVAKEDPRISTVRGLLKRMEPEIRRALPKHMDADRMLRLALTAIRTNPDLLACTSESLMAGVMDAAQVGLEINGLLGHAYLVPYRNRREGISEAKCLVGYKGFILLGRRSKQIETIEAHAVFEEDDFDYQYGSSAFLKHIPARGQKRGPLVGAWAMTRFKGSAHPQFEFMDRDEIEARRRRSRQADKGPWVTDYPAMAVKTLYRQHSKIWPLSPIERGMIETEDLIEAGVELPPSEPTDLDAPVLESPPTRSSQIADALEGKTLAEDPDGDLPDDPEWEAGRE